MEDPGKECDKDGGGEVDDGRQTPRPGTRHVDDDDDDDDEDDDGDDGGEVDDRRQTTRPGICQPEILRRTIMMMMVMLESLVM